MNKKGRSIDRHGRKRVEKWSIDRQGRGLRSRSIVGVDDLATIDLDQLFQDSDVFISKLRISPKKFKIRLFFFLLDNEAHTF